LKLLQSKIRPIIIKFTQTIKKMVILRLKFVSMKNLRVLMLSLFLGSFAFQSNAQYINAGPDTVLCPGQTITLTANTNVDGFNVTNVSLTDDIFSGVVNIGFDFVFYGNTYNQCLISSNNYITFNTTTPNQFSPWTITNPVPDAATAQIHNAVLGPWQDINPGVGGTVRYATIGDAPNRVFVVEYCNVPMFSCTQLSFSSQIQLHETTNIIETHIINKPLCTTWNSGQAVHATHELGGAGAVVYNNRNAGLQWVAANEGTRFEIDPNNALSYIAYTVPFAPAVLGASGTISWTANGVFAGTGANLTVSPTDTTEYVASINDLCSGFTYYDTVYVFPDPTAPDVEFQYSQAIYCPGEPNPTPTLLTTNTGTFLYTASPAGLVFVNDSTGQVNLAASALGTYTITLTVQEPGIFCPGIHSVPFTIQGPQAQAGPDQSFCSTVTSIQLNGNVAGGATTGTWTGGNGTFTPSNAVLNPTYSPTAAEIAAGFVNLIFTSDAPNPACPPGIDTVSLFFFTQPALTANAASSTVCSGTPIQLSVNVTGTVSNLNWTGGQGGSFSNAGSPSTSYTPSAADIAAGQVTFTVSGNAPAPCSNTFSQVTVTITETPTATLTGGGIIQSGTTLCPNGNSLDLTITLTGAPPFNLVVNNGQFDIPYNNIATSPLIIPVNSQANYSLISLEDANGCPGTVSGTAQVDTFQLVINPGISPSVCGEDNGAAVANIAVPATGNFSYQWNTPNNDATQTVTGLPAGTYTVTVTEANGCSNQAVAIINQLIGVVATASADPLVGVVPLTTQFINNTTGATNYSWDFAGLGSSNEVSPSFFFETPGTYVVILTAYNVLPECQDTATVIVIVQEDFEFQKPNVFTPGGDGKNDKFTINGKGMSQFRGEIYNRWGRKVFEWTDPQGGWDGNNSEAGTYYYILNITDLQGKSRTETGHVTLIK
jgi:gliding motility-associated-like protein